MSRFQCPSCNISFESDEKRPRCPRCLRQHGLEQLRDEQPARPRSSPADRRRRLIGALLVLSLAGLLIGGLLLFGHWRSDLPRPGEIGVVSPALLRRTLLARGVPSEWASSPFASSPALRRLASEAGGRSDEPAKRARALAIRLARELGAARADLSGSSSHTPARSAADLLEELQGKRRKEVSSVELAMLAVGLCREAGLPAVLGLVRRLEAPVKSAVTPGLGRYIAVVYAPGKIGRDPVLLLDPMRALVLPGWAGGGSDAEMQARIDGFTPLDDGSAAAHLLAVRAYSERERDPRLAYLLSERALQAASPAAELHLLRAAVLAAAGGSGDALVEVRRALALREDPSGRLALAGFLAEAGRFTEALAPLKRAVAEEPDYWPARALLASLEGAVDPKRAEPHLEVARRVAPDEPMVLTAQAASLLGRGDTVPARDLLRRAAGGGNLGTLLLLYQALLRTGEDGEAKAVRDQLLRRARPADRAGLERALETMREAVRNSEAPASAPVLPPLRPKRPIRLPDVRLGH